MRMFSLGSGAMFPRDSIVGIFDLDTATVSGHTREYLRRAQEAGAVVAVGDELPQSFIVTNIASNALVGESAEKYVYLSPLSSANLSKKLLTIPRKNDIIDTQSL